MRYGLTDGALPRRYELTGSTLCDIEWQVERFRGEGRIAARGFEHAHYVPGQLLGIGHAHAHAHADAHHCALCGARALRGQHLHAGHANAHALCPC